MPSISATLSREEANRRLVTLDLLVKPLLQEMINLCKQHDLTHTLTFASSGKYITKLDITSYSDALNAWTESKEEETTYPHWDSSEC